MGAALDAGQNLLRPFDDHPRDTGQPCDLNSVTPVRSASTSLHRNMISSFHSLTAMLKFFTR